MGLIEEFFGNLVDQTFHKCYFAGVGGNSPVGREAHRNGLPDLRPDLRR